MKFILNENIKFILNERFILNEADQSPQIFKTIDAVAESIKLSKEKITQLKTQINQESESFKVNNNVAATIKKIEEIASKVTELFEKPGNKKELVGDQLLNFVKTLEQLSSQLGNNGAKVDLGLTEFQTDIANTTWEPELETKIKQQFENINSSFKQVFKLARPQDIENSFEEAVKYINELSSNLDKAEDEIFIQDLKDITLEANLIEYEKSLNAFKAALDTLDISKEKTLTKEVYDTYKTQCQTILEAYVAVKEILSKSFKAEKDFYDKPENKLKKEINKDRDWGALYKKCSSPADFEKFWNDYYKSEWPGNEEFIKSLGRAFTLEIENYGWTRSANPFVDFLKNDLAKKLIPNKLNKDTYAKIHNAVVNRSLKEEDLRGTGLAGKLNLIFNPYLYDNQLDFNTYLEYQNTIINKRHNFKNSKGEAINISKLLPNILFADGDFENFSKDFTAPKPLRSVSNINTILKAVLGDDIGEKESISSSQVAEILKKITKNEAPKMLSYLVDVFGLAYDDLIQKLNTELKSQLIQIRNTNRPSYNETIAYKKALKLDKTYGAAEVKDLILGLAKVAEIV